ncbi:type II toxin-antitoxin system VapC family toxin [Endozoicomonas euniceicola]|uniref:Type II toxin-antitoxin system VapC family toxin n=1 Tax=Endozoicomonas euniceicola TaxID=1234143 RepID=A0ABY6GZ54_9GAMM|nr:type II toxin-antitoxin system VapC family toxin [Endozoicomonas euniceicola]UYM18070.1 type II toxin-antitoxin system VapC family toxin [Endozoicomonas euniceicola]
MTDFVLDNSVTMRWVSETQKVQDQEYAERVLKSLIESDALVPNLWHLEVVNISLGMERRGELSTADTEGFIAQLENLPIYVDALTSNEAFGRIATLARSYKLSSYDAAYLELAIRESIPLATLDKDLGKAARKAGVDTYFP